MKDLNDIMKDDTAFEELFVQTMHKIGSEQDKERIKNIRDLSGEEFRQVIGARSGMKVTLQRQVIRYATAACVACLLVFGGGIGGIQYGAYHQTTDVGDRYLSLISTDISYMKGEMSEDVSKELETLFNNVTNGKDLKYTITRLREAYSLSADEDSEYNHVRNRIGWNLAMAYLKDGDRGNAKPILKALITDPDNDGKAIQERSQQVLENINLIFSLW